ncbi:MAG TPA: aminoacetone oxidase family FAD-binding enzyme [Vicinamibacterales bacterium]|nr:aminoacetone oxidase family FAD-binding enzyme [Vicinamibacterales bacterium]
MSAAAGDPLPSSCDIAIVGGGAAGVATAIFAGRARSGLDVHVFEGAVRPGAKILVSGGARCNVTNAVVVEHDFNGGRRTIVRQVIRALSVPQTRRFFETLGVPLHEEADGKLFPDANRARSVLEALLRELARIGAGLHTAARVSDVLPDGDAFVVRTSRGNVRARRVVLATGGRSLPKSGSDGHGYDLARALGHRIVPTTPALAPLVLDGDVHAGLAGVSHRAVLTLWTDGRVAVRVAGSMLWTHFGISGPAALDMSRHWARAAVEGRSPSLTLAIREQPFDVVDRELIDAAAARPATALQQALASTLPAAVAAALLRRVGVAPDGPLGQLSRADRRAVAHVLTACPLPVVDTRGYTYAEATAGGVDLGEVDPKTMASRVREGLFLVGEILDVDGRLGGFNFQWAWSSAYAAGTALARENAP